MTVELSRVTLIGADGLHALAAADEVIEASHGRIVLVVATAQSRRELAARGITFLTLRQRGPKVLETLANLPATAWTRKTSKGSSAERRSWPGPPTPPCQASPSVGRHDQWLSTPFG
ncbi:MAG: hypothetical protein M3137_07230 [Actinomycetota bacterium]|nr:hypothetical protein [Actinomycetota bacterium]